MQTLDGKDMIQFFDSNGNEQSGLIFPEGIPSSEIEAIREFVNHEGSANFNLVGGYVKVDTDLNIDKKYYIKDGSIFQNIANKLGVSLPIFLSFNSGNYTNSEFYFTDEGGKSYVFD